MSAVGDESAVLAAEEARPKPKPLGLSSSGVFLIVIVIQLISYIPTYFLSRLVGGTGSGQALLGTIQLFLLIASSVNNIADLRIGSAFTFFVSRGEPPRQALTTYLALRLALVAAAGVSLFVLSPSLGIGTMDRIEIFGIWMLFPIFWSFSTVYMQTWVALGDSVRSQLPQLVEAVIRAGTLSYVALVAVHVTTPTQSLWAMTAAYAAGVAASTLMSIPTALAHRGRFSSKEGARMLRWAWPLMGSLILLYIASNLIQFVVVAQLGTAAFNRFSSANSFRILALAIPTAIALPLFPYLVGLHKRGEYEAVRVGTWQALRYTAMVVVPGVVALVIYRTTILNIFFQQSYVHAARALAILALASIPAALSQIIGTALNSIGRQRLELYLTTVQVAVLIVAAPLLIGSTGPFSDMGFSGINGAALAVFLSAVAALALNTYFMERLLAVRIQARPIIFISVSAAASFGAISRLNALINVNRYYSFAAGVVLGFTVYVLVLILSGELSKADVELLGRGIGLPPSWIRPIQRLCWREAWPDLPAAAAGKARGLQETKPVESPQAPLPERKPPPGR